MINVKTKLSENYIEILKDEEYYDIIIEVGKDPNAKIFRAHNNNLVRFKYIDYKNSFLGLGSNSCSQS